MSGLIHSVVSSQLHLQMTSLYTQQGLQEKVFSSMRKAMIALKKESPDYLVADFVYGYSNNYAGVNVSNLDVMLIAMQRYSPKTKVIVLAVKDEIQYVDHLNTIFPLHGVLLAPISDANALQSLLTP